MQDDREEAEAGERFTTISKCHKAEALHAAAAGAVLVALEPRVCVPTTYPQLLLTAPATGTGRLRSQLTPTGGLHQTPRRGRAAARAQLRSCLR